MKLDQEHAKSSINFFKIIFVVGLVILNCFAFKNLYFLSRDMLYGDFSSWQLTPQPLYLPLRLPATPVTLKYRAVNRLGIDFAQIYFPAQELNSLDNAYDHNKTLDPRGRASRYAPAILSLCAVSLCRLDYGPASLLQLLIQYFIFLLILYLAFRSLGIREYFWITVLCANICFFLTPVGLSWFERGQFSLYVGSSFLMLAVGLLRKNPVWIAAAAQTAFIKWTTFPVVFIFLAVYLLNSRNIREFKAGIFTIAIFSSIILFFTLLPVLFVKGTGLFLFGLINQELTDKPSGLTLLNYFPRYLVKLLPLLLIILGYINIRTGKRIIAHLIPYWVGVVLIMLLYPTVANDYSVPGLIGLVPIMIHWARQVEFRQHLATNVLMYMFIFFILLASFSTSMIPSILAMTIIYLVFSILFMVSPSVFAKYILHFQPDSPAVGLMADSG